MRSGFSAAISVVGLLLVYVVPAVASLTVSIQPPMTCAELGDTVEIAVNATGPDSVGWYYIRVYTDEAVLTYLGCSTQILSGCPTGSQCMECGPTGEPGIFSACCACLGTHTCVAAGDLVVMRYVATGEGMSPVLFDGAYVDDCDREDVILDTIEDGVVYVGQAGVIRDEESATASLLHTSCYPNPFTGHVTMTYTLCEQGSIPASRRHRVTITIFDCTGSLVRQLVVGSGHGEHFVDWDGRSTCGRPVPPGVYFCRFKLGGEVSTHKITRAK